MASTNISQSGNTGALKVYVRVRETSADGNYRTLSMTVYACPEDGYGHINRDGDWKFTFSGETDGQIKGSGIINADGMVMFESDSVSVYVEPGQTFAEVNISFEARLFSSTAGIRTVTGKITKITGLSAVIESAIDSVGDFYFGSPCNIVWIPASPSFYYKLKFSIGTETYITDGINPGDTNPFTYEYEIPDDLMEQFPNSDFGTMNVSLYTYNNSSCSTQIGSTASRSFQVKIPDSVVPDIDYYGVVFENDTNDVVNSWGFGLVGHTSVKLIASAIGVRGATIVSFEIIGDYKANPIARADETNKNKAHLEYIGGKFNESGNKTFHIRCIDSRGRKSEYKKIEQVRILPYVKPEVLSLSAVINDKGTVAAEDNEVVVTATWNHDQLEGNNHSYGKIYYKQSSASTWTPHTGVIENSGDSFTLTELNLSDEKSYSIQIVVTDSVGKSDDKSSFLSTAQVLLDFRAGGKGLGVGKICESDSMEVSMDATFYNGIYVYKESKVLIEDYIKSLVLDAAYPVGTVYTSLTNINPASLFGGKWEQIQGRFLLSAGSHKETYTKENGDTTTVEYSYNAGDFGGEHMHKLTISELPKHSHGSVYSSDVEIEDGKHMGWITADPGDKIGYGEVETGGEAVHNNMPPYLVVYMWKRTE